MNPQIKARWVAALRSGEYRQGTAALRSIEIRDDVSDGPRYCCLGVLCDLYMKEHPDAATWNEENGAQVLIGGTPGRPDGARWVNKHEFLPAENSIEDGEENFLPDAVMRWSGLEENNPIVRVPDPGNLGRLDSLASLNDTGADFTQIANAIEETL